MYLTRFFIAFMLLLIPAVIDADIQGELATPGSKDFLSIQPCSPHLGEYPTARIVAYQFGYNPEVLENLTFDLSPSPTVEEYCSAIGSNSGGGYQCTHGDETGIMVQCYEWSTQGRNARNTAYTALCQDYPSWEPYLWENEMTGVFYSIDVDYPLIAQLARFNNGVFQSEICDAEVFTAYGGCHTVASTVGLSANHQERWDNAVGALPRLS